MSVVSLRAFFDTIVAGDLPTVHELLAQSPHLASESLAEGATRENSASFFIEAIAHQVYEGDTALHVASAAYRGDIAQALIAQGASVHARNRRGAQPVHYASEASPDSDRWNPVAQSDVIARLLDSGANPNATDKNGVAPLHRAVRTRATPAVRTLLAGGADVDMPNGRGSTPLQLAMQFTGRSGSGSIAAREQQARIVRLLLEHGARPIDLTTRRNRAVRELPKP